MFNMYDEDNVDLEEQLYLQEVQEELDAQETEEPEDEEDIFETDNYELTKSFLDRQLYLVENDRQIITMLNKKFKTKYSGIVLGRSSTDDNKYVFNVSEVNDSEVGPRKIRIFNFKDLKKA